MAIRPGEKPSASEGPNDLLEKGRYRSIAELAALKLPGFPRTRQSWYALVERNRWPYRETPARGGRQGTRREYLVPPWVDDIIQGVDVTRAIPFQKDALGPISEGEMAILQDAFDEAVVRDVATRYLGSSRTKAAAQGKSEPSPLVDGWLLAVVAEMFLRECQAAGIDLQSDTTGGIGVFAYFLAGIYSSVQSMPAGEAREKAIIANSAKAARDWRQRLTPRETTDPLPRRSRSKRSK